MADLYQQVKRHPIIAAAIGVLGALISLWSFTLLVWSSFNVQDPLIPAVWAKVKTMQVGQNLLFLLPVVVFGLSLALIVAVVVSAFQNKREVMRLEKESADQRRVVVFEHLKGNAALAESIHGLFKTAGWDSTLASSHVREHAEGVRILGGRALERAAVTWGLVTLGISPIDDQTPVPMLQVVVGRTELETVSMLRKRLSTELEKALANIAAITSERDAAVVALKDRKETYASNTLYRCSMMRYQEGEQPRVTIRFASYADDRNLVDQLKALIKDRLGWPVKLEKAAEPMQPASEKCKVVFVGAAGIPGLFAEVAFAFSEGDYLGVPICSNHDIDVNDQRHLVINVLP